MIKIRKFGNDGTAYQDDKCVITFDIKEAVMEKSRILYRLVTDQNSTNTFRTYEIIGITLL